MNWQNEKQISELQKEKKKHLLCLGLNKGRDFAASQDDCCTPIIAYRAFPVHIRV